MKKYIAINMNEFLTDDELLEMANLSPKTTGIDGVCLWIGPAPERHGNRIKVSNVPDKFERNDCFVITIPDLKTKGRINAKFITADKLKQIKKWIVKNEDVILKYSDLEIGTEEMISQLQKIKG